ncbi:chlororespiratory reduction protein 7 [Acaryochloris sp. IP29b_bin.148]|uniref:chlororespiratory reduction protein 7 n=1 Tax=Acaryochloris sp. IP29b_bin.148 TaxID=2969218 RepID=UPI0026396FF7|nr:chlororespiratory reduction protein 7 [Acaryochloris sp. IP29b_bin.148]
MPDSLMYSDEEMYVVLETNQPEQLISAAELLTKLESVLSTQQDDLPPDLQSIDTITAQAQHLMATSCELDVGPSQFLQWYVVRLEK